MGSNHFCTPFAIIGPKHSGKTSVGRLLAEKVQSVFIDLDVVIQEETGFSPRALYEKDVEYFRKAEMEALHHTLTMTSPLVIAAGGGIIDNPKAFELLKNSATLIYLDLPAKLAWERIRDASMKTGSFPPFLRTEDPEGTHRILHERRAGLYKAAADFCVNTIGKNPQDVVECIVAELS